MIDPDQTVPHTDEDAPSNGRWETLAQAFQANGFPLENLPLVQRLVDSVGITHYEGIRSKTYVKAFRRDGAHWLWIHSGFTGGMKSEAEVLEAVGDVDRSEWDGTWTITHPTNRLREGGGTAQRRAAEEERPQCPIHFVALPVSGVCSQCD